MATVSVVLATYNGEKYLRKQLESIKQQTVNPTELVISDDHSTDSTNRIIEDFFEELHGIKTIYNRNRTNVGFIQNFRKALSFATSDYIFLCDQDDIWHKKKLESMLFDMENNQDIQSLVTSFRLIDENDNEIKMSESEILTNNHFLKRRVSKMEIVRISPTEVSLQNVSPGCTSAHRYGIVSEYLRRSDLQGIPHDWALNLIASHRNGLFFRNTPTISYRIHSENAIGIKKRATCACERSEVLDEHIKQLEEARKFEDLSSSASRHLSILRRRKLSLARNSLFSWIIGLPLVLGKYSRYHFSSYMMDLTYILRKQH